MSSNPRLPDVLEAWRDATLGLIRTACPAIVQSYDAATLTAVVKLTAPLMWEDPETGVRTPVAVPPISVAVSFPSSAGASITWPLAAGDTGLVVFADRSTDGWRGAGVADVPPQDGRRFGLEDGHFVPCTVGQGGGDAATKTAAATAALVLRAVEVRAGGTGATSAVSLDTLVRAELQDLWNAVAQVNAAIPTAVSAPTVPVWPATTAPGTTASTSLKAE